MAKSRKRGRIIGIVATVVIVLGAVAYVVKDKLVVGDTAGAADSTSVATSDDEKEKKKDTRIPVEIAQAGVREISSYYVTTATLEPEKKVDILTKTTGEVVKIIAEEGDFVKAGTVLAKLDDREAKITLEESRITRDQQKRETDRLRDMASKDLISDKEWSDATNQYELAKNKYASALLRYKYTQVRAPFDGIVTERAVDEGENVNTGAKLFVLSDVDPLQLTMFLPEGELKKIHKGQLIQLNTDIDPDTQIEGRIIRIAPEVDQRTGTVRVTAETSSGGLPGSFVRVRIVTDTRPSTLPVPRKSLVTDSGDRFVFIAAADTVRRVEVTIGFEDQDFAEITSGLAEGDTVVTAGVGGIREGAKVKVLGQDDEVVTESAQNN